MLRRRELGEGIVKGADPAPRLRGHRPGGAFLDDLAGRGASGAAAAVRRLEVGAPGWELLGVAADALCTAGGTVQKVAARSLAHKEKEREAHQSLDQVFPVPLVRVGSLPRRGRGRARAMRRRRLLGIINTMLAVWNLQYLGREQLCYTSWAPTAAQRRIQLRAGSYVEELLRDLDGVSGEQAIQDYLKQPVGGYDAGGAIAMFLGLRAGVPARAGAVNLASELCEFDAETARQVLEPRRALLPPPDRPVRLPRGRARLAASYPEFVSRTCKSQLQSLRPRARIFKHRGAPIINGAFAVAKSMSEDRAISNLVPLNTLISKKVFWKPVFARMPSLRTLYLKTGKIVRMAKRDCRHFFHQLAVGRRWMKFFAHPAVPGSDLYPCHRCDHMGFAGSVSWAQRLNEKLIADSTVPMENRVVGDSLMPADFPVWGSILDDVWALEVVDDEAAPPGVAAEWVADLASQWNKAGLEENMEKQVVSATTGEVQGAYLHGKEGWLGVSRTKRMLLLESGLAIVGTRAPAVKVVERWVGKLAFAQQFRPATRANLESTYYWLDRFRRAGRKRATLWKSVASEMLVACLEIATMRSNLRSEWCSRVEASDASPGGHGRAYTHMDIEKVSLIGRMAEGKGCYTNLSLAHGLECSEGVCPMEQVLIDHESYCWKEIPRRGGWRHITLEEGAALVWSLHDRLRRPADIGKKVLHLVDSAALCGAMKKADHNLVV